MFLFKIQYNNIKQITFLLVKIQLNSIKLKKTIMQRRKEFINYRNREINIVEFFGPSFYLMEDIQSSLLGRSRKSIVDFCKLHSIPIITLKDGNTTIAELIEHSLFQKTLISESQSSVKKVKKPTKKLPGMSPVLFYTQKRRAQDFLKCNNLKSYMLNHMNSPENYYRAFGILVNAIEYYKVIKKEPTRNPTFNLDGLACKDTIVSNIDNRIEFLVDFLVNLKQPDEDFSAFVSRILTDSKLTGNEQFFDQVEVIALLNHNLVKKLTN